MHFSTDWLERTYQEWLGMAFLSPGMIVFSIKITVLYTVQYWEFGNWQRSTWRTIVRVWDLGPTVSLIAENWYFVLSTVVLLLHFTICSCTFEAVFLNLRVVRSITSTIQLPVITPPSNRTRRNPLRTKKGLAFLYRTVSAESDSPLILELKGSVSAQKLLINQLESTGKPTTRVL